MKVTMHRLIARTTATLACLSLLAQGAMPSFAQSAQTGQSSSPPEAPGPALRLDIPHSWNPISAYRGSVVAEPNLQNSNRINSLIHNGALELSLKDAIDLALENNLDLAIARYNIPIAQADIMRTQAGGSFRGVNTGIVQNTPGAGVGGFGSGTTGAGAGGTSGGAGGAGTGASGLVQSTLGEGTNVNSYDPTISTQVNIDHATAPLSNKQLYGVSTLQENQTNANINYSQAFATGTAVSASFLNSRVTTNSPYSLLDPTLNTYYQFRFQQQLLAGFGLGPNLRFMRIAKNNQKISDESFKLQVITTVTQIAKMYWDLVAAYEDEQVKDRSLEFARQTLESGRKQLELQAIPGLDVLKDEGEVATREQDLTIAKSQLQFNELLMKNALTKNLDDPILEAMPVRPTDHISVDVPESTDGPAPVTEDLIAQALRDRLELRESTVNLENLRISRQAARNALLPQVSLTGYYAGTGLAGVENKASGVVSTAPTGFGGAFENALNNSAPEYYVGVSVNIPLRNRQAKSDQYRSELEARQAELYFQQQKKQIRIEVRNAQYTLEQSAARVQAARKGRDLAQKTFDITAKEQELGSGSNLQTLSARRDLAVAESALVAAMTDFQKGKIELERTVGSTLDSYGISIESARTGSIRQASSGGQ